MCGSQKLTCRNQRSDDPNLRIHSMAWSATSSATSIPLRPVFITSLKPAYQCQAAWRSANELTVAVRKPAFRRHIIQPVSWKTSVQDRCGPSLRSEEHTSELQSRENLVCRLL